MGISLSFIKLLQGKPDFSLTKMKHVTLALLVASAFIGAASAKDCSMVPELLEAKFGDIGLAAGDCLNDIEMCRFEDLNTDTIIGIVRDAIGETALGKFKTDIGADDETFARKIIEKVAECKE